MTTQNGDVGGFVRIKTEVVDDEYDAARSDLSGGQSPSFAVYIDNAHTLSSAGHLQLGCIKEEPVALPVDSSLVHPDIKKLKDETGNSIDDNMEDQSDNIIQHSTKDSGEKFVETPDNFQSAVNWEVVKVFKCRLAAPCVRSSDTRENVCSFDSSFSDSSVVPYPKPGNNLSNKIIKEEIIDKEYDMEITSAKASRSSESCNVDETWLHSENLTHVPVKEELTHVPVKEELTHVPVKEELVGELTNYDTFNECLGTEDRGVSAEREVDAHDPGQVLTSCLSNDHQRKAATNCCFFQRKFEQYVMRRNMDETNTTPQHEDSSENNDPFQLPKTGEKETQTLRTLCKHSPPVSPSIETDLVISPEQQPAEKISLSLPKRGRKRQVRKTLLFKVHACTVCSAEFDSHKELKAHSFVHKRKYRRYSKLLKMMKSTSSTGVTALFPCRHCRKSFTFAADLTKHLESHEEQRWYETVFTKYQLSWNQVKHLNRPACEPSTAAGRTEKSSEEKADDKLHAGTDAHACMVCGSLFPTDLALRMHMHHPEKPLLIENPQLLAPDTDHQKPKISNQKPLLQFAKPHTFSERDDVLVHSKESSRPESSDGEHGPEKTAKDGSEHNEDNTPLNVNILGSLSNLPAMDSDRGQTADETFTSGRKRKRDNSSQQALHTLLPLHAHCDREKENERSGDTSQGTRPHIDHSNALVESSIKKRTNEERFVSCAHISEAENYSGTKTVDSVQSKNSHSTGNIGEKSDVNTLVHGPGDHQITFHCSSKPDTPPPFVRDESSSNEISSLNEQSATMKSQTCDGDSCLLWEEQDAGKLSLTCKQSSWGDLPSSVLLPFQGEHWCPHLSMVKRREAHCEVRHADGTEANCSASTCTDCKKNEDTHEHLRRLFRHDDSASDRGLHAQPLTKVWSACPASEPLRRYVTTRGASHTHSNATEDKGPDKAQTKVSNSHRLFRHWHRRGVFTCRYCSGVFDSRQGLSAHQRIHIKTMPYDCNQCTQRFHTRVDLQAHQRWHLGSSPCVCVFCSAVFPSVKGLNHHLTKYKRANLLAGNSCQTSHSIPVPFLAQSNESAPFLSSVNCRSELLSTWVICPLSSPDVSLRSKSNTPTNPQAGGNAVSINEEEVRSNNDCTTQTVHRSSVSLVSHVSSDLPVSSAATAADRSLASDGPFTENAPLSTAHAVHGETSSRNKTSAQQITDQNWCVPVKQQVLEKHRRKGRPTRHEKNCFRPLTDQTVCTGAEGKEKRHRKGPHKVRCRRRNRCKSSKNTSHYTCIKTKKHGNAIDNAEQRVSLKRPGSSKQSSIEAELKDLSALCGVREDVLGERGMPTNQKKAECPEKASVLITPTHDTACLCSDCQNSFPDKLGFDQHLHVQDSQHKYLTCFVCPQSFVCYRALERHVAEHTSERGSCTFLFPRPSPLSVGAARTDPQVAQGSAVQSSLGRDLMCSFCGRTFLNGRGLWKHTESHTPGKRCKGRKKRTFTMRK